MSIVTETKPDTGPYIIKDKYKSLTTEKILYIVVGVVLAGVLLPPIVSTVLWRWPKLCCRYADINIKTGQVRYVRYLGLVKLSDEVADTAISLALEGRTIDVVEIEPWHPVYRLSPGVRSPCYRYVSALGQARQIELIDELIELSPERRRRIAEQVLKLWQTEGDCSSVSAYLQTILKEDMNVSQQE
jgi:hypothetical protein